jgi:small-conductance mechanosensitive channel
VQFGIIVAGLWLAASSLGFSFSNVTLLIGALTVGIGFGLQDVVRNVMGGLILLSEGLVRPDDVFEIGDDTGVVERIGIRTTTIRAWDGAQVIVPNSYLISEKVVDLSEAKRVEISVGVSRAEDPRLVERLLAVTASSHPDVLQSPAPSVFFANLGQSSIDFVLYCHTAERANVARIESDLRFAVVNEFRHHGIEIAYPRLDLRLESGGS